MASDRQYDRYYHHDVADLTDLALYRELRQVDAAIGWAAAPRDMEWFVERLAALRGEAARRGMGVG